MKLFLSILLGLVLGQKAPAQDPAYPTAPAAPQALVAAEYFFDTDPGFGAGTPIAITPGVTLSNVAASVNTSGLSNGIHRFCLRTRSGDGGWGITNVVEFLADYNPGYPTAAGVQNINRAEYFIDTDPGFGLATPITITPGIDVTNVAASINTAGLSNGVHKLLLRTQSADGKWSLTAIKEFLVDYDPAYPAATTAQNIIRAEYFIDADPGFGSGTPIAVTPAADIANVAALVNTSGLSIGVHRVYLRTKSGEGPWSLTAQKDFLVDENPAYPTAPAAPGNLVYAEYFFDTDPGTGHGTPVTFSPAVNLTNVTISVSTAGLADGNHKFFLRTLDDWSLTGYQTFMKGTPLPLRFLSFYAKNKERGIALEWKTDNEINTAHFDVERSGSGQQFEKIGVVRAVNAQGQQAYTFEDAQPFEGKNFYRLKQVDKDGKAEYSATVMVNRSKAIEIQVFPNPAQTMLTILVPVQRTEQRLTLLNAAAQTVKTIILAAGTGNTDISLDGLAPGQYFIKWQSGNDVRIKAFVKQ